MSTPAIIGIRTGMRARLLMVLPEDVLWGTPPEEELTIAITAPRLAGLRRKPPLVQRFFLTASMLGAALSTTFVVALLLIGLGLIPTSAPSGMRASLIDGNSLPPLGTSPDTRQPQRAFDDRKPAAPEALPSSATSDASMSQAAGTTQSSASSEESPQSSRSTRAIAGVYLTAMSIGAADFLEYTLEKLTAAGGSAIVFDVKSNIVEFHAAAPTANAVGLVRPLYELPAIIGKLHERGVEAIARFVAFSDSGITEAKPSTRVRDPANGKVLSRDWADPGNTDVIDYNMELVCELATAGVDEVNLDYVRFPTNNAEALRTIPSTVKADRIEKFLRAARETINRCGPKTRLGISTYAILGWQYEKNVETLGQDIVRFASLVDVIAPMAYPSTFAASAYYTPGKDPGSRMYFLVHRTLQGYQDLLGPVQSQKLRPWIQGYGVTRRNMLDEIQAVYDAGICGYTVWNADNAYAVAYQEMDAMRAKRPTECQ